MHVNKLNWIKLNYCCYYYYYYYCTALCYALAAFSVPWSYTQSVAPLGRGISPSQGLYLDTEQHKHRINAHNTDIHALSGIRTHDHSVSTVHALDRAATVIGHVFIWLPEFTPSWRPHLSEFSLYRLSVLSMLSNNYSVLAMPFATLIVIGNKQLDISPKLTCH
jgi:hypothetical protein